MLKAKERRSSEVGFLISGKGRAGGFNEVSKLNNCCWLSNNQ